MHSFERFRVLVDLSPDSIVVLGCFSIHQTNLAENFSDLPQRINFTNVVSGTVEELSCCLLDLNGFLLVVAGVGDAASICESIVHSQLLLELFDFIFIASNEQVRVRNSVH